MFDRGLAAYKNMLPEAKIFVQLASEIYTATVDTDEGVGLVSLFDAYGRLVSCFRNNYVNDAAEAINRIA